MKQAVVHAASVLSLRFWPRHHLMRRVALGKHLNKDGLLITEDSVFPTTAPGGAPKRNRCYQDARYFIYFSPLRPASFARSARLALLTTLRPRWGLALFDGLGSSRKVSR